MMIKCMVDLIHHCGNISDRFRQSFELQVTSGQIKLQLRYN